MIKLAVFDMDGTLLSDDKTVLASTVKALRKLKENNIALALATGRPFFGVSKEIIETCQIDYLICCNGNAAYDAFGNVLYQTKIPNETIELLTCEMSKDNIALFFEFKDVACAYSNYVKCHERFNSIYKNNNFLKDDTQNKNYHNKIPAIQAACYMSEIQAKKYIQTFSDYDFIHYGSDGYDIVKKGISKVTGIEVVCKEIAIKLENVIAFGDHLNDLQMIKKCKIGVAMGNAINEIKDVADFITKSNNENAIATACESLGLISIIK